MDDATIIAEADAALSEWPKLSALAQAERYAGGCDAVLEAARLLRLNGMSDAALVLVQNIEQVARGARS